MLYYSKTTQGFYDSEIHGTNIPPDCVEISQQLYDEMFAGQSAGKKIVPSDNGMPMLIDPPMVQLSYYDERRNAYPPIGDQLDALFHAGIFPPEMAAKLQAVKDKYPKS